MINYITNTMHKKLWNEIRLNGTKSLSTPLTYRDGKVQTEFVLDA